MVRSLGTIAGSDIHFAANEAEVMFNVHRWNDDLAHPEQREAWGRRRIRYFVSDATGSCFAPCKFAAYLKLPAAEIRPRVVLPSLTGMTIVGYREIPYEDPIFDGHRAWTHLRDQLGFRPMPIADLEAADVEKFERWIETCGEAIQVDGGGAVILRSPDR